MNKDRELAPGWTELTPEPLRCGIGPCPGIYKTPTGSYVIIGRTLSSNEAGKALPNRIDGHETAIERRPGTMFI